MDEADKVGALGGKIAKAASYLHTLFGEGHVRIVMLDLFGLGTLGQAVAIELHKRLTAEQQRVYERELQAKIESEAPQRHRRGLDDLANLHDKRLTKG